MARYSVTPRRKIWHERRQARRAFAAQGNDLASKAFANAIVAIGMRIGANYFCSRPEPDYALCKAFSDAADRQAEKLQNSLLALDVWGGVALIDSIFEK
jgi:hypothetical protein